MATIRVTHYSDILCIWAYVCQIRLEELLTNFPEQVEVNHCLFSVFGAAHEKIDSSWGARGGIKAYNKHVLEIAQKFDHIQVHEDIWVKSTPHSSLPAHLYLFAIKLLEQEGKVPKASFASLAKKIRQAFFAELLDISNTHVLSTLANELGLPDSDIQQKIDSGQAFAAMASDMQSAKSLAINSSPTLLFNEDRQRLAGNVGYRIIEANVRELLEQPGTQQTWC